MELSHRLVCTFVNLHLQMLISVTKLSCCLLQNPASLLLVRKTQEEREERVGEKGTSKPVARIRGKMKVLESGKEGRGGDR